MSENTLTGILEWPSKAEGRVRQVNDAAVVVQSADDPYVPVSFGDELPLRNGLEVTVEVVQKKSRRRAASPAPETCAPSSSRS